MAEHTPTPWHYRPHHYDDWGWIRATPDPGEPIGVTVAMARSGKYEDEGALNEHRRNKTDPYGANAQFIVKACNSHDALVKALTKARARIEYLGAAASNEKHFESNERDFLPEIDAALQEATRS